MILLKIILISWGLDRKKHKKKFLRREERIEAEKRQKIKDEKEQKKVNLAEEKLVKKEKREKDKSRSKRKNNEKRQNKFWIS